MAIQRTTHRQYRIPDGAEDVDVAADLKNLADDVDVDVQQVAASVPANVEDLANVQIAGTLYNKQILAWNSTAGKWENTSDIPLYAWVGFSFTSKFVTDVSGGPGPAIRWTGYGKQLRARMRATSSIVMDEQIATLPASYLPPVPIMINCPMMGPGPNYVAGYFQIELKTDGVVTAREPLDSGSRFTLESFFAH